jgi:Zn-dependent protease
VKSRIKQMGILFAILVMVNIAQNGLSNPKTYIYNLLITIPGIVIGLSFHEFGHAFVSDRLGDPTPRAQGRVTLNPFAHFDPFGFFALIFCGFGWGVPVQIDPRYYKHPRRDEFLVSIAGVIMNLFVAIVFSYILHFIYRNVPYDNLATGTLAGTLFNILLQVVIVNVVLMIFNLIPIPPLDGFGIITEIFNLKKTSFYETFYNNGFPILMILMIFGIVSKVLNPIVNLVYSLLLQYIIL